MNDELTRLSAGARRFESVIMHNVRQIVRGKQVAMINFYFREDRY